MRFTKMHGLGNDYIYVNEFEEEVPNPPELSCLVSDRHFGIGGDGLILVGPSQSADVRMRIFNADGSEAEMCGNGVRCVAKYAFEHGLASGKVSFSAGSEKVFDAALSVETKAGVMRVGLLLSGEAKVDQVCVNMGQPILKPSDIPVDISGEDAVDASIEVEGESLLMTCVSMGNPHAVIFCDDVDGIDLESVGHAIENHSLFPNRVNAHFVQVIARDEFKMRTWERGSGVTLACGTGACACCVAAVLTGRCSRSVKANLPGGSLELDWNKEDNCVYMTGPAVEVFKGVWPGN